MSKENKRQSSRSIDDLPDIEDVADVDNPKSYVFYGLQNTGKTTLFSTFPKPALLLDFNDRGTDSVSDVKDLSVARIETPAQLEAVYWALKTGKLKHKSGKRFKSIGFDTVTGMQDMFIKDVTGADEPMTWGSLSRRQFGDVSGAMKRTITDFRDLDDYEIVFLAQQKIYKGEDEDDDHGDLPPEIGPALMPSVSLVLNAAVNTIGQTYKRLKVEKKEDKKGKIQKKEKVQFCLYIGPNPVRMTKIRKPRDVVPPSYLVNPTYEDLIEALKGE